MNTGVSVDEYQQQLYDLADARRKYGNLLATDRWTRSQRAEADRHQDTIRGLTDQLQTDGVLDDNGVLTPEAIELGLRII